MKKFVCYLWLLLGPAAALAQYAAVPSSSYPTLDGILNGKLSFTTGVGAPGGMCTAGKDVYTSTAGAVYWCTATNTWTQVQFPTLPVGAIVGTTDTQTLTNKTVDGVTPAVFGYIDPTSSIQTQINSKQAALGFTAENAANKGASSGYAPLNSGGQVPAANLPIPGTDTCDTTGSSVNAYVCTSALGQATTNGKGFYVRIVTPNTGSSTLTINSVIWTMKTIRGGAAVNLVNGDLLATSGAEWYHVVSNGTFWNVVSRLGTDGSTNGTSGQGLTSNGSGGFGTPLTMPSQTVLGYVDATSSVQTQMNTKEATANKGAASGYAPLNSSSKVPAANTLEAGLAGVLKYTAGVPAPIGTSSTNCVHEDGSSSACPGGGGTGNAAAYTAVTFSATPTFTATTNTVSAFSITLTGNVTSSTLAGSATGQAIIFKICQDGTGSRTFVWPTNVTGAGIVDGTASGCSQQSFVFDGSNAVAVSPMLVSGVPDAITLNGSTSQSVTIKPAATAGNYTITLPSAACTSHQWWNVTTCAQPAFTDVSGLVAAAQLPAPASSTLGGTKSIDCTGTGHILKIDTTGTPSCSADGGGGGSLTTGGGDFFFGTPFGTSAQVININGSALGGTVWAKINTIPTSTHFNFAVTTAAASGSFGVLWGIYTADLTSALCVTTVGTGAVVSATGDKSLTWASGANVSGGTCTIPLGSAVALVVTSDSIPLQVRTNASYAQFTMMTINTVRLAGYANGGGGVGNLGSGSAGSLAFVSPLTGVTLTAVPTSGAFQPVVYLEN